MSETSPTVSTEQPLSALASNIISWSFDSGDALPGYGPIDPSPSFQSRTQPQG